MLISQFQFHIILIFCNQCFLSCVSEKNQVNIVFGWKFMLHIFELKFGPIRIHLDTLKKTEEKKSFIRPKLFFFPFFLSSFFFFIFSYFSSGHDFNILHCLKSKGSEKNVSVNFQFFPLAFSLCMIFPVLFLTFITLERANRESLL